MSQIYIYTDYVHPYYARKMLNLNIVVPGNVIWKSFSVYTIFFGLNVSSNAFPRTLLLLYNFYYFATGGSISGKKQSWRSSGGERIFDIGK